MMIYTISHRTDTLYRLKKFKDIIKPRGAYAFADLESAKNMLSSFPECAVFELEADTSYIKDIYLLFDSKVTKIID